MVGGHDWKAIQAHLAPAADLDPRQASTSA